MKRIGYVQISSKSQNLDEQFEALKGVSKLFVDNMSGQTTERLQHLQRPVQHLQRPQLKAMLDFICEKDIVVIAELNQLSNKNKELIKIMKDILKKGATLEVLNILDVKE